jgi:hypothetical protein
MPTTRGVKHEDKTRWKNLVRESEKCVSAEGRRAPEVNDLLRPAWELAGDEAFCLNVSEGLAAFLAPGLVRWYRLPMNFDDQVVIGSRFHIKPLKYWIDSARLVLDAPRREGRSTEPRTGLTSRCL